MDDEERSEREEIRKPRIIASTAALSRAISVVDLPNAVLIFATSLTPRSVSASRINGFAARVLTEVSALSTEDYVYDFCTTSLRPVYCGFDVLQCVVLGGQQA